MQSWDDVVVDDDEPTAGGGALEDAVGEPDLVLVCAMFYAVR